MNKIAAILIFFLSSAAFSNSHIETNRQTLMTSVYGRLVSILAQALQPYDAWDPAEKEFLYYMLAAAKHYAGKEGEGALKPNVPLHFSRDQSLFRVVENAPPRSAVIGPHIGDAIYFNLNVINQNENKLRISQITQLLMHEFGHFVPKKSNDGNYLKARQALIDSIAAKIGKRVETLEKQFTLSDGTVIRAMSATEVLFGTIKTPTPTIDQFIAFNPFFFIVEKDGEVLDQTIPLLQQLETRRRFEVTEQGKDDYHRMYTWNIESIEQVKENEASCSWLKLRATQVDLVIDAKKSQITAEDFEDVHTAPDKAIGMHEFIIGINKTKKTVDKILSTQRFQAIKIDDTMAAQVVHEDQDHVVIRLQLKSADYQVSSEKQIRLMLQTKDRYLSIQGKKISENEYEFQITKPKINFEFSVDSIAVHGNTQVFFKQALRFNETQLKTAQKEIKIQKMGLSIEGHYQAFKTQMDVPTQEGALEFFVQSDVPLREIEIYESKSFRILNEEANKDFVRAPLRPELKTPSIRTDFQIRIFEAKDLRQEKISEGVYKVTVPYDFSLSPLNLKPNNSLEEALKKNPLEAFLNIQKYLQEAMTQTVSGTDLGLRALYHMRFTNQNFDELTVYKNKPFYIRSGTVSPYKPAGHRCQSLFKK